MCHLWPTAFFWYSPHGIVHDLEIVRDVHYGIFRGSGTPEY